MQEMQEHMSTYTVLLGFWLLFTYLWRLCKQLSLLYSDILQSELEQDHKWGIVCISWSFASEPEPSGIKVSAVIYVLQM